MFGNNFDVSKFYSGRHLDETEVKKCLQSFGAVSCVSHIAVQNMKFKL